MEATLRECAEDYSDYIEEIRIVGGPYIWGMVIFGPWNYCIKFQFSKPTTENLQAICKKGAEFLKTHFDERWTETWEPGTFI